MLILTIVIGTAEDVGEMLSAAELDKHTEARHGALPAGNVESGVTRLVWHPGVTASLQQGSHDQWLFSNYCQVKRCLERK